MGSTAVKIKLVQVCPVLLYSYFVFHSSFKNNALTFLKKYIVNWEGWRHMYKAYFNSVPPSYRLHLNSAFSKWCLTWENFFAFPTMLRVLIRLTGPKMWFCPDPAVLEILEHLVLLGASRATPVVIRGFSGWHSEVIGDCIMEGN